MTHIVAILQITLRIHTRGLIGVLKAPQLDSGSGRTDQPAESGRLDDTRPSGRRTLPSPATSAHRGGTTVGAASSLRAAMLLPHAAVGQPSKVGSKAASDSLLPPTECSLRSGCAVDESYGVSRHSSTVCGRVRAGKLTWVSLSVGQHSATAPALVRAHIYLSANCNATLLQPRRLAEHALLERLVGFSSGLKHYMVRIALHVVLPVCSLDSNGRTSGVYRNVDLRQNATFSQISPT